MFEEGVHGGESDVRQDADGNASRGGQPPWVELQLAVVGRNGGMIIKMKLQDSTWYALLTIGIMIVIKFFCTRDTD